MPDITRYYTAELYRIESSQGNVTGVYGTKEATRTMTMPNEKILNVDKVYGNKVLTKNWETKFDNDSGGKNARGPIDISSILDKELSYYLQATEANGTMKIRVKVHSDEDGSTWSNEYYLRYKIGDTQIQRWGGRWIDEDKSAYWCDVGSSSISWNDLAKGQVYFYGDTGDKGAGGTKFWTHDHEFTLSVTDSEGPGQIGIAPAATTDYHEGDKVTFSVVYDELITKASDVTVDANSFSDYMPLKDVKWTGKGLGTNVLVFEGIAAKNFSNTTWESTGTNEELMDIRPVKGTVTDMKGNSKKQ